MIGYMIKLPDGRYAGGGDHGALILSSDGVALRAYLNDTPELIGQIMEVDITERGVVGVQNPSTALSADELAEWDAMLEAGGHKEGRVLNSGGAPLPTTTLVNSGSGESVTVTSLGQPGTFATGENESHIAAAFQPPTPSDVIPPDQAPTPSDQAPTPPDSEPTPPDSEPTPPDSAPQQ